MYTLYIGNKNYSSWSMRPWVLMRQSGIDFNEVQVRFDSFAPHSQFKQTLAHLTPTGKVPLLVHDGLAVWDTLAITEYLAEQHPGLWPSDAAARARARCICAEMHSGFAALRSHCPMNIEAHLPEVGALVWRDHSEVRADVARLQTMWSELLQSHDGPMLFGDFSAADAYFAPVCMRLHSYALPVNDTVAAYVQRVRQLAAVQQWLHEAQAEGDFLPFEEPYRLQR